jgi:hypothetical protein
VRSLPNVHRVDKRIRAVSRPQILVGKFANVPHELVHDLRQLGGVGRWASTTTASAGTLAVGDVALVIGGVQVLAVPAGGEDDGLADKLALGVFGNGNSIGATARSTADEGVLAGCGPAAMADVSRLDFAVVRVGGGTGKHTETLLEGGHLAAGDVVDVETTIVDELTLGSTVPDLWYGLACCSSLSLFLS